MKKASEVFKKIRFAKLDPKHEKAGPTSTDDEEHYAVSEKEYEQQLAHAKKRAMQEEKKDKFDIGEYDQEGDMAKSDLRSIIANAKRVHDMLEDSDNLPEWVQSKITKAEDYISTVANYMQSEMSEEVEQIDEVSSDLVKKARDAAFAKGKEDQGHRFVRKAYEKGQKESEAMAKKINEVSNDLLQRYKKKAGEQVDNPATPSATKLKRGVGHLKATSKQMTSGKPMPKEEVEQIEELSTYTLNKYKTKATAVARSSLANARYGDPDDIDARNKSSETYEKRIKGIKTANDRLNKEEMDYSVKVTHRTPDGETAHKVYKVVKAKSGGHAQSIALNKHTAALDKAGTKYTNATTSIIKEDLRKWFDKDDPEGGWKRINSKGEAIGPCAREPGEPKPKCMSNEKRAQLSKKERAAAVAAKRKHDPNPERKGEPINVSNYGKGKLGEDVEQLDEKNVPTSPEKWAQAKAQAKAKFDVYPSAYANGWAAKKYKAMGGGWKSVSEAAEEPPFEGGKEPTKKAVAGKHGVGYSTARHLARMALKKQQEKMKPLKKVTESKKAEIVKRIAKKNVSDDKFQPEPELNSRVQKVNDVDPFINK